MPLTTLDNTPALVVIDLQKGIAGLLANVANGGEIIGHAGELARAFREKGLPVVLVNVAGRAPGRVDTSFPHQALPPDWTEIIPELEQQPTDLLVTKQRVGAFIGTSLDSLLRERGVTQIFLVGVATSMGVESTARSAHDLGYNVVLVADAMTDLSPEAHRHSVGVVFPRLGEVTRTAEVLERLKQRR